MKTVGALGNSNVLKIHTFLPRILPFCRASCGRDNRLNNYGLSSCFYGNQKWLKSSWFTFLSAPDAPPQNIVLTRVSHSSLKVNWSPVPEPFANGILRGYVLYYNKTSDKTSSPSNVTLTSKNTSYVATKLLPSTSYSFWVRGYTVIGLGVLSAEHQGSTDESGE